MTVQPHKSLRQRLSRIGRWLSHPGWAGIGVITGTIASIISIAIALSVTR